jgi:peroxiredoxin
MRFGRLIALTLILTLAAMAVTIPRPSPEFVITLPDGKQALLSQYRGKIVALAFVSTTCPHCQRLTQALTGIQRDYGARGVQVLETAINQGAAQLIPAFIQQYKNNFPTGHSDWNMVMEFLQISIMSPGYLPKIVFIDRKGIIQAQYAGENPFFADQNQDRNVRAELDKMLQASAIGVKKTPARKTTSKK